MDDLTQDKICEIVVQMNEIDLQEMGFDSCADINPEAVFTMMSAMMKEEGVDLEAYGVRSFEDVNVDTAFNAAMIEMKNMGIDMSA